jgi:hypothetical protein
MPSARENSIRIAIRIVMSNPLGGAGPVVNAYLKRPAAPGWGPLMSTIAVSAYPNSLARNDRAVSAAV